MVGLLKRRCPAAIVRLGGAAVNGEGSRWLLGQSPVTLTVPLSLPFHGRQLTDLIYRSFGPLGPELITFFTGSEEECRAWPLERGSNALAAAGAVHSDLAQGFIRAEVIAVSDLIAAGSEAQARQQGTWGLEGKGYLVQDGDVINIRFKV